ncbi:MAG: methylated-DNA--[protein]-cysteine S-methyltransferase [Patulibacter sp.]
MTIYTTVQHDTLGELVLVAADGGLTQLTFTGQRHDRPIPQDARRDAHATVLRDAVQQLDAYWRGELRDFELPLAPAGSTFQLAVWDALQTIPYGETTTYGAIAASLAAPSSPRAVGGAVGRNPIGVIVPCHRVVGSDGTLTGYAGGMHRKRHLLELERAAAANRLRAGLRVPV